MGRITNMTVAFVTDSHGAGTPGQGFIDAIKAAGAGIIQDSRVGRRAIDLTGAERSKLDAVLAKGPDIVVYELGTNDWPGTATNNAYKTLRQAAIAAGAKEVWMMGPPAFADGTTAADGKTDMNDLSARNNLAQAQIFGSYAIDGRPLTASLTDDQNRTSDGIHFTSQGVMWGQQAAQKVIDGVSTGVMTQATDVQVPVAVPPPPALVNLPYPAVDVPTTALAPDTTDDDGTGVMLFVGAGAALAAWWLVSRRTRAARQVSGFWSF